jgi:hypothetical protein
MSWRRDAAAAVRVNLCHVALLVVELEDDTVVAAGDVDGGLAQAGRRGQRCRAGGRRETGGCHLVALDVADGVKLRDHVPFFDVPGQSRQPV